MERTEATSFGVAFVGHVALIWALKLLLDSSGALTPPPAMEVSFVDEAAMVSSSPSTEAAAPAVGEDLGPVEEAAGTEAAVPAPEPEPIPEPEPVRTPSPPTPRDRPEEPRRTARSNVPSQVRPQPQPQQRPQRQQPQRPQQQAQQRPQERQAQRGQGQAQRSSGSVLDRLSREFGRGPANSQGKAQSPPAATVSTQERANFASLLGRQIGRCARQQRPPAIEARSLRPVVVIRLREDGSLDGAPLVRTIEGVDESNRQYEQQARDAILRAVRSCAPYTGLPPEQYAVPNGWRQPPPIRLNFQ